jgi:hypothetical protein
MWKKNEIIRFFLKIDGEMEDGNWEDSFYKG